jgi:signal transduction histidine kinase
MYRHPAKAILDELDSQLVRLVLPTIHILRDIHFCDDINVDAGRFVRILLNLAKNSLEAMEKGGVLRLGLRQQSDRAIFHISDTGCIPPEVQARLLNHS